MVWGLIIFVGWPIRSGMEAHISWADFCPYASRGPYGLWPFHPYKSRGTLWCWIFCSDCCSKKFSKKMGSWETPLLLEALERPFVSWWFCRYPERPLSLPECRLTSVPANSGTPYVLFSAKVMLKFSVNFSMTLLKIGHMGYLRLMHGPGYLST